jgi:hypothetical protein
MGGSDCRTRREAKEGKGKSAMVRAEERNTFFTRNHALALNVQQ